MTIVADDVAARSATISSTIGRIDPVELAQNRIETDVGEMLVTYSLRDLYRPFDNIVRRQRQLATAGLRRNLNLASSLQIVHQDERLGDASSLCQGAVVTQKHHSLVSKIDDKFSSAPRAEIQGHRNRGKRSFRESDAELIYREQTLLLRGNCGASHSVEMHDALRLRNCLVNHTMDDPSRGIDFAPSTKVFPSMSTSRRLDAVTSSNNIPKGMNRNRLSRPGRRAERWVNIRSSISRLAKIR